MTEVFREEIKNYPHPLFYNSTGSSVAYKLYIKHLSAASFLGFASEASGFVYPHGEIHLVDLEEEKIIIIKDEIKLIKLEN